MCVSVPSPLFSTHAPPKPDAIRVGERPTGTLSTTLRDEASITATTSAPPGRMTAAGVPSCAANHTTTSRATTTTAVAMTPITQRGTTDRV